MPEVQLPRHVVQPAFLAREAKGTKTNAVGCPSGVKMRSERKGVIAVSGSTLSTRAIVSGFHGSDGREAKSTRPPSSITLREMN